MGSVADLSPHATADRPFYVYVLLRPDGRPFYVGKGISDRINRHESEARTKCECHKCHVIRKVWKTNKSIRKSIIFTTAVEAEAYQYEARLIDTIGLSNLTNSQPGQYRMTGKRIKPLRDRDPNPLEYRNTLCRNGAEQADVHMRHFLVAQLEELERLRRYAGRKFTPEKLQQIDDEIEALQIAIWPERVQQSTLWEDDP